MIRGDDLLKIIYRAKRPAKEEIVRGREKRRENTVYNRAIEDVLAVKEWEDLDAPVKQVIFFREIIKAMMK